MKKTRRQHSAEFKSKVALEALKEQKTLSRTIFRTNRRVANGSQFP